MFESVCPKHGTTQFIYEKLQKGHKTPRKRCKKCRVEDVTRRRRLVKQKLVNEFGGCCQVCGYNRYIGALEFHHKNPKEKEFRIGEGCTKGYERLRTEAKKCVLVCSNCHKEIEGGFIY